MKKLFLSFATLALGLMVGCSYDDSALLEKIAEMEKEHTEMQEQLDAQQALLEALANKLSITEVNETENGYTLTFSDGTTLTITNGNSHFSSVVVGEDNITFTLADGTVVVIPLGSGGNGNGNGSDTLAGNNKIYYTTTDGKKLFPETDASLYGAIIISNTYKDGQGVLTFDDEVTSIDGGAFRWCSTLTSITIPDSVTSIGDFAFDGCSSLTSVTIGKGVISIGYNAFYDCSSLTRVNISDLSAWCKIEFDDYDANPLYYGAKLYLNNVEVTELVIPSDVTEIKPYAFYNCSSLTSVTIPDSVTSIGSSAFDGCSSLTGFYGKFASADNRCLITDGVLVSFAPAGLTTYTIPDSVTTIKDGTFSDCDKLSSITVPDSVTSIGYSAFSGCSSLTSITIGSGVTTIRDDAFYGCTGELIINSKVVETDYTPNSARATITIVIGGTTYANPWLRGSEFTKLTIGDNITKIGDHAFAYCDSLKSATIGNGVTSIGRSAFYNSRNIEEVYCKPTTPPSMSNNLVFAYYDDGTYRIGCPIYVPTASVDEYKAATNWSSYADYIVGYNF